MRHLGTINCEGACHTNYSNNNTIRPRSHGTSAQWKIWRPELAARRQVPRSTCNPAAQRANVRRSL